MKYNKYLAVTVTAVALMFQAADAGWGWEKVRGSGELTTKEVSLDEFVEVMLAMPGTAYVESGSENKVIIDAEDNLIEYIKINERHGKLVIETEEGYSLEPRKSLTFRITTAQPLEQLTTASSGDIVATQLKHDRITLSVLSSGGIEVDEVEADNLELSINSSGDIRLRNMICEILDVRINSSGDIRLSEGRTVEQNVRINSSGDYRAIEVESEEAYVTINSSGDVHINVANYLHVRGNSSGDVRLVGSPRIDSSMNSSGRIQRASI